MMYIAKTELHPKEQTLRDFAEGKLDREETVAVTAHLASCLNCINKLAEIASEMPCEVPVGFEEEVNYRIAREKERKAEFRRFSFRVSIAACAAIFLLSLGTLLPMEAKHSITKIYPPDFSVVNTISSRLSDFSQKILNLEVFQNAETEK
jgi:anti-sigma factor RsiW